MSTATDTAAIATAWNTFAWSERVPSEIRQKIINLWCRQRKLPPEAWIEEAESKGAPPHGAIVRCLSVVPTGERPFRVSGCFVYISSERGKVIAKDGTAHFVYCNDWTNDPDESAPQLGETNEPPLVQEVRAIAARYGAEALAATVLSLYGSHLTHQ